MSSHSLTRRYFLRGAAGAMLALPFLESLLPRVLRAQASVAPKRLIVMKSFSTQLIREWYPAFTGNGYALKDSRYSDSKADGTTLLSERIDPSQPYTWAPLRDFETPSGISGILGARLNPFLDKINLVRGLDFLPSVNHNYGGILGNYASCTNATPCTADSLGDIPTIDQVLAYSDKFYSELPGQRALHISQGVVDSMSFGNGGQAGGAVVQQLARTNPLDVWNDLFAGLADSGTTPPSAGPNPDALLVDKVLDQYRALRDSSRLSGEDKQKVEQYVSLISEVQARLNPRAMLACTKPMEPQSLDDNQGTDPTDIQTKWDIYLDLVTAALMCDRTRIVTIGVHKALGPGPDPNDPTLVGHYHSEDASGGTWHGLAHDFGNENSRRMLKGINAWIADNVFAKLLEKLDVTESGGSTLLDNSLVYWGNELGFNHIGHSVPCLLAGSAGGALQTGRYLDYIDWEGHAFFSQEDGNVIKGIPHNQLLVTALQAMGLTPADYERDGQAGYGSTFIDRDSTLWPTDYDLTRIGQALPGLSRA